MKLFLPTVVIEKITQSISNDYKFFDISQTNFSKILSKCLNVWYYIYTKNMDIEHKKNYVNIHKEELNKIATHFRINGKEYYYSTIIQLLKKGGVIDVNEHFNSGFYKKGTYTKSYRYNSNIISESEFTEVEIDTDKIFENFRSKDYWLDKYPQHSLAINKMYNFNVQLDKAISFMHLNKNLELKPKSIKKEFTTKTGKKFKKSAIDYRELDNVRILEYTNRLLKFLFKNLWFQESSEGRLYTSLTSLPSILRQFITSVKDIEEIDVNASQATVLANMVSCPEFKFDIENGDIYTKIGKGNRNIGKHIMIAKVMFSNRQIKSGKYYDVIEELYPGLMSQINNIKKDNKLWSILQTMESDVFIKILSKMDIIQYTVHDSVGVYKDDMVKVSNIIKQIYWEKYNIKVQLK